MRNLLTSLSLAAVLFVAAPSANAQFFPLVGYDIDYEAFMVGLGAELAVTPAFLPVNAAIRPSVEYVFVDNVDLFRVNGDLVARFGLPGVPLSPYGKAGVAVEVASTDSGAAKVQDGTNVGINLGGGATFGSLFIEATAGILSVSNFRVTAGYQF